MSTTTEGCRSNDKDDEQQQRIIIFVVIVNVDDNDDDYDDQQLREQISLHEQQQQRQQQQQQQQHHQQPSSSPASGIFDGYQAIRIAPVDRRLQLPVSCLSSSGQITIAIPSQDPVSDDHRTDRIRLPFGIRSRLPSVIDGPRNLSSPSHNAPRPAVQ